MQGVSGVNTLSATPPFHPQNASCLHVVCGPCGLPSCLPCCNCPGQRRGEPSAATGCQVVSSGKATTLAGERTCRCGCQFRKSPAGWIETIAEGSSRSPSRGYPLVSSRRNKWSVCSRIRTQFTVFAIFDKMIIKDPQSRFQWKTGFRPQNGGNVALDHMYDSHYFVVVGIGQWPHDGRSHSYPAGYRHRRGAGPGHSRTKTIVAI